MRIIALFNQKGGVGKTTSTVNLGAALAAAGKRVILVDLDPQANLTTHVGIDPHSAPLTTYRVLTEEIPLAEALLPHALQPPDSTGQATPTRFLLLRAETAREHLPDTLRAAGADVTIAPVYRTVVPSDSIDAIRHLFSAQENWPAAITFTSSSTATNLLALLEVSGLSLPQEIQRISIGPITSQTLGDLGYPPHAEAAEPNLPSLVAEVVKALGLKNLP